jgi:formylmethanofuran dehydrogenase subunit E
MAKYKILNVTYRLNKRDVNYNKTLSFEVADGFKVKKIKIEPNQLIYLDISKLPLTLQKYRMEGLITVLQINDLDYNRELEDYNNKKLIINNKTSKKATQKQNKTKKDIDKNIEKTD